MTRELGRPALLLGALVVLLGADPSPRMEHRTVQLDDGTPAHALFVDAAAIRVLDARDYGAAALTAEQFAEKTGATAVINASFFDVDGKPLGLLVVDGDRRVRLRRVDWGVFSVDPAGTARIDHTDDFDRGADVRQAVQAGPRLVVDSHPLTLKKQSARRTAVCTLKDGRVAMLVVDGSVLASSMAEWFVGQGCTDALNLDGGPSTQLYLRSGTGVVDVQGGDPVPVALAVFDDGVAELAPGRACGCR